MSKQGRKSKEKVVVIFIEGDTEVEFYKRLVSVIRTHCGGRLSCSVETVNVSGIGQYKKKALRIFEKQIKIKYPNGEFYVALCYDQDVFEIGKNPPVNWQEVKKDFQDSGVNDVRLIKAIYSIEDWFLCDTEGLLRFLHLPTDMKLPNGNGYVCLKALFKRGGKLYIKGKTNGHFVQTLDVEKILFANCRYIAPLCKLLGVDCKKEKYYKCNQESLIKS